MDTNQRRQPTTRRDGLGVGTVAMKGKPMLVSEFIYLVADAFTTSDVSDEQIRQMREYAKLTTGNEIALATLAALGQALDDRKQGEVINHETTHRQ